MTSPLASTTLLLARIDDTRIGFSASAVREIVRSVAIAPLTSAPAVIEGAVNLRGSVIPIVDARARLGMPPRANSSDQFLVILETSDRHIAIRVDDVDEVVDVPAADVQEPASVSPVLQRLAGVAAMPDGALVIYDVDAFLNEAERALLDERGLVLA